MYRRQAGHRNFPNAYAIKTRNNPKKDVKREGGFIKATFE